MTEAEDAKLQAALDDLIKQLNEGKITMKEYNAQRRALLQAKKEGAPAPAPEAAPAPAPAPAPVAAAAAATPPADQDPTQVALDELIKLLNEGKITMKEYNARRRALLHKEVAPADATAAPAPAAAPPAEGGAAPPAAEPPKPGWGAQDKRAGTKVWSEGARTDDPTLRQVHAPNKAGIGDGKAVFFLFGFKKSARNDQEMLGRELEAIKDDIEVLRDHGYTVVVDPQGTKSDFIEAVTGEGEGGKGLIPVALYWSAHGHEDGALETCDGGHVMPADMPEGKVHPGLKLAIMAACYVGAHSQTWKKALGGKALVVGWGRPVTIDRAVEFLTPRADTETDLDDLITRYLLRDTPLPGESNNAFSVTDPKEGRVANLNERVQAVASMLGARWRQHDKTLELDVPLPNKRSHYVHMFVVDSQHPYTEGEPLLAVEADVGEITSVVDPPMLLAGFSDPGYARVALVKGKTEMPRIVAQGFMPLSRVRDTDLAALVYQVALVGDELEKRVFGGDMR